MGIMPFLQCGGFMELNEVASGLLKEKCNILLVDRDRVWLNMVSESLRLLGHTVSTTDSAGEAVTIVKQGEVEFNLILAGFRLPGMEDFEFIKEIKKISHIPVVVKPDIKDEAISAITEESSNQRPPRKISTRDRGAQDGIYNYFAPKKLKPTWNDELHNLFLEAVKVLGIDAQPEKIHKYMNIKGLTSASVSRHWRCWKRNRLSLAAERKKKAAANCTSESETDIDSKIEFMEGTDESEWPVIPPPSPAQSG